MIENYVMPGTKLEIAKGRLGEGGWRTTGEDNEKRIFKSDVTDVISDDEIEVNIPSEKGKLILYSVGEQLDLCFYTKKGLYQCFAEVKSRSKDRGIYRMTLSLTSALRKFQRREYYRFNCVLNMHCRKLNEAEKEQVSKSVEFIDTDLTLNNGVLVDISGGGTRFVSDTVYEVGELILFRFSLHEKPKKKGGEDEDEYSVIGRVVSCSPKENARGKYEVRVEFVNINERDRENIIRYIFEEERKMRKGRNE